jgi:hypothetical protein
MWPTNVTAKGVCVCVGGGGGGGAKATEPRQNKISCNANGKTK